MGYAFISYSSKNQQIADSFRTLLNRNGIETWMAPGDIPFGSTYTSTINRAIKGASCFVLLLSESAQGSPWVLKETERAVSTEKTIFTVFLDNVPLNDDFEFMLSSSQAAAIRKIDEGDEKIKKFLKNIKTFTGEEKQEYKSASIDEKTDINSAFSELREKYPDDVTLLDKFFKICLKQQESILISNCDFEKRADYIAFFKKHLGETILCIEMQKLLDEMVLVHHYL